MVRRLRCEEEGEEEVEEEVEEVQCGLSEKAFARGKMRIERESVGIRLSMSRK